MTNFTYSLTSTGGIQRSDGAFIPADLGNRDYVAYQAWVAAGNAAAAAVPPPPPTSMSSLAFFDRFTQAETQAVWKAAAADSSGALGAALVQGLSGNQITPTDATVAQWLAGLVAAGAITSQRAAVIAAPPPTAVQGTV